MSALRFGTHQFESVGKIVPRLDSGGSILEYRRELKAGARPNHYASGPFCRFELPGAPAATGVYALTAAGVLKYIGECEDLARRFGPNGYGSIAARNCHHDGQSTNCKVNSLVLASLKAGEGVEVWFYRTARRKEVEGELLVLLKPPWNGRRQKVTGGEMKSQVSAGPNLTAGVFRAALEGEFHKAAQSGQTSLRVKSGDLHRSVGGYPGRNHRMPVCCQVMASAMAAGDNIVEKPPKGKGARLTIEYRLPRPG